MVEVGRKRKGVVQPEKETEYEMRRNANILANEKRIQELNLRALSQEVNSPIKKNKKVSALVKLALNIESNTTTHDSIAHNCRLLIMLVLWEVKM
jgi:hypothetical protein